ncbi:hypothetical protein CBL_05987 [Carabus blaptoides fortunei]
MVHCDRYMLAIRPTVTQGTMPKDNRSMVKRDGPVIPSSSGIGLTLDEVAIYCVVESAYNSAPLPMIQKLWVYFGTKRIIDTCRCLPVRTCEKYVNSHEAAAVVMATVLIVNSSSDYDCMVAWKLKSQHATRHSTILARGIPPRKRFSVEGLGCIKYNVRWAFPGPLESQVEQCCVQASPVGNRVPRNTSQKYVGSREPFAYYNSQD